MQPLDSPQPPCPLQAKSFDFLLSPTSAAWLHNAEAYVGSSWPLSPLALHDGVSSSPAGSMSPHSESPNCQPSSATCAVAIGAGSAVAQRGCSLPSSLTPLLLLSSSHSQEHTKRPSSLDAPLASPSRLAASPSTSSASSSSHSSDATLKHRRLEVERRLEERDALRRLEALSRERERDEPSRERPTSSRSTARQKRKRHKLTVLQASADRIEQLEQQLRVSRLAHRMAEARARTLAEQTNGGVVRARHSAQWLDESNTLSDAGLLSDRFVHTLFDCRSGRLLNASNSFLALTGFTPNGALQRLFRSRDPSQDVSEYPLVRARRRAAAGGARSHGSEAAAGWEPLEQVAQFPRTLRLVRELFAGQRDAMRAPQRYRWANGCAYETHATFSVIDVEWVQEADGRRWRRPLTFACASLMDDCTLVDED